jgi:hypothetical protein
VARWRSEKAEDGRLWPLAAPELPGYPDRALIGNASVICPAFSPHARAPQEAIRGEAPAHLDMPFAIAASLAISAMSLSR